MFVYVGRNRETTMSERIITKEVTKKKEHKGWKVYIDGSKFPKKPVDFYTGMTEEQAVKKALEFAGKEA